MSYIAYISVVSDFRNTSLAGEVFMRNNRSKGNVLLPKARLPDVHEKYADFCTNHLQCDRPGQVENKECYKSKAV